MTSPDDGRGRVWIGVGLARDAPLGDALRANLLAEDAAVAEQLAAEAKAREQLEFERDKEREFFGVEKRSVVDVFLEAAVGPQAANVRAGALSLAEALDREDRRERRKDEADELRAAEAQGRPPRSWALLREAKAERERREAEAEATPVSEAAVERKFAALKNAIWNATGKRLS
jgi:hypothetical protein